MIKHEARGGLVDGIAVTADEAMRCISSAARNSYRDGLKRGLELAKDHARVERGGYEIVWSEVEKAIERE